MIKQIRLVNCQSLEDITFNFATDKLNVLVADNSTGKSVLFKMLKVTANPDVFPAKKRSQLIRRGAESAIMACLFDTGDLGMTVITQKAVIYKFKPYGETDFFVSYEPDLRYIKQLGLLVDTRTKFVANIIDTDQDMLLVNSDQRGNHELMCLLAEYPDLIELKDKVSTLVATLADKNSKLVVKESSLKEALKTLNHGDVRTLESSYQKSQNAFQQLEKISDALLLLEQIHKNCSDGLDYNKALKLIENIIFLQKIVLILDSVTVVHQIDADTVARANALAGIFSILQNINPVQIISYDLEPVYALQNCSKELDKIVIASDSGALPAVEQLIAVQNMHKCLKVAAYNSNQIQNIESDCYKIKSDLLSSGRTIQCPIHGEVVFDGTNCLPTGL